MKKNNKNQRAFRVIFVLIAILLCGCVLWIFSGDTVMRVTLKAEKETYPPGITSISCTLRNSSFRIINYGEPFVVEHYVNGAWVVVNDNEESLNFELGLKTLFPLSSAKITYPLSWFSSFEDEGDYRIKIQVQAGTDYYVLFCPFSVKQLN